MRIRTTICAIILALVSATVTLALAGGRHVYQPGAYFGPPRPSAKHASLSTIAGEIFWASHEELECGGCLDEPGEAAKTLRARYGRRELLRRCVAVAFCPDNPDIEPAVWTACAIMCREGDDRFLQQLMAKHGEWLAHPDPVRTARQERLDKLIAGLCKTLGKPQPAGIPKLETREWEEMRGM